jgi:hypothetical protein
MINRRANTALRPCVAGFAPCLNASIALLRKRAFTRYLRPTLMAITISAALSGCGVFCGGGGGSGGGFAGGCATGVRF